jgi:DnaJ-class molecular chaperone
MKITCYVCNGTGESSHGAELWETHVCGKCKGKGVIKE